MLPIYILTGFFLGATAQLNSNEQKVNFGQKFEISIGDSYASFNASGHEWKVVVEGAKGKGRGCQSTGDEVCVTWGDPGSGPVLVGRRLDKGKGQGRERWKFTLKGGVERLDVMFNITSKQLYGGPVVGVWPQQRNELNMAPFVSGLGTKERGKIGEVIEKIWVFSDGSAVTTTERSHLFITQNSNLFQLTFMDTLPYNGTTKTISYEICTFPNLRLAYDCYPPEERPVDGKVIKSPIWSTWVRYKAEVDQEKVLDLADQIKKYNFPMSVIEIDDNWETCYGNHKWDLKKFPNPRNMVSKLQSLGVYVTLWVHPFINVNCPEFESSKEYLVKNGDEVHVTTWWNGKAGVIELRTQKGRDWFKSRLTALKTQFGVDGFKFDAGEAKYLPMEGGMDYPDEYTNQYVKFAGEFGVLTEVRVGAGSRNVSLMQRLQDKNSDWSEDSGLRSVIPDVLSLSASGYLAILPDMVGGNRYGQTLTKELFIRWLQLNTFLPYIQFSVTPWDIDDQTVEISRKLLELHNEYSERFIESIRNGIRPINPVWWLSPTNETSLVINDEFLVGDNLLVAPVLEKGANERKIYFPPGSWLDPRSGKTFTGPKVIENYPAPIDVLPYFIGQFPQGNPVVLKVP